MQLSDIDIIHQVRKTNTHTAKFEVSSTSIDEAGLNLQHQSMYYMQ